MNILKIGNRIYRYEAFWRLSKDDDSTDYNDNQFPYPRKMKEWNMQQVFLTKLLSTQKNIILESKKNKPKEKKNTEEDSEYIENVEDFYYTRYEKEDYKDCFLCEKKNIIKGLFTLNNIRWENGLSHYIKKHNIKPTDFFIDTIFRFRINPAKVSRIGEINGKIITKSNLKYLKIERNQILIMDALQKYGGYKYYTDGNKDIYRYSEHAGVLDFNNNGLEKIIVYGNTDRVDIYDDDIFLPGDIQEMMDYEYIFHTHPATPKPGGRVELGILYEIPSISDIFHFMDHYNEGKTQGSIVIAPEGMYIIRKLKSDNKKIRIDQDKFYVTLRKTYRKIQEDAVKKFGEKFTTEFFYSKIAQDKVFINEINRQLNKFDLHIDYYSRIKNKKGKWIIDTIYIPVFSIEIK